MLTAQSSVILIVDDQPTNLKMLFSFLQESGYKVLVAKRGESAIKKLQRISPDLILLDVMLPGIDGFETCQRLKALPATRDIPVIFMTALSDSIDKIKGLKVGAVDYITKPFQQEEVLARIENQLKIRKLQKQLEEQNQQLQQEIQTRRRMEEQLELVIQAANDGFWDWNLESEEIYFSPRWKEMLGYSDEELPNELTTWEHVTFPEDRISAEQLTQVSNSGKISRWESTQRLFHKDGSTVYILSRTLQLRDANGHVNRIIGAHTDITEITNTLEALRHSRRLLAGVLNSSLDGVAAFSALRDNHGQITDFIWLLLNPAAEKMVGRSESELVGQQMRVEIPEIFQTGLFEKFVAVVETGDPLETEFCYKHNNIRTCLRIVAVKFDDGFAVTFRDITERKQMEEQNRALLDAIPDMMFRQRVDGTFLDVRAEADALIAPHHTRIGNSLKDMPIPEAIKQGLLKQIRTAVETGELQTYEYELPMPNGVHTYESRGVKSGADEALRIVRDITKRKQAEAALRESEARFRGIFESAAIGIGLTGTDGQLIAANPTLEAFLGYSEAEMRSQDFTNITYPEDRTVDLTLTQEVIDGVRDSFQIEKRYIRKDGQIFWGRLTVSAVRNPAGEFQFTVAMLEDINDSKLQELVLRESERRFRAIFNNSFQFTGLLTPDGIVIEVNQTALDFGGVRSADVTGVLFWNTLWWRGDKGDSALSTQHSTDKRDKEASLSPVHSSKQEQLRQAIQAAAAGEFVRYEVDIRGVRDRMITIDFSIKPVFDETGTVVLLIAEGRDISERKKAEQRLRLLESAVVSTNDAVIISQAEPIDWPGPRIIYVNEAFTRMTGYSTEEVLGQTPRILQGEKTDRTQLERIRHALETWESVRVELINYRKDGSEFWVELEIVPVADETGWYTHWVSVQRDITERKQAQEALLMARQRLEYLLSASPSVIYSCQITEPYGATFVSENVSTLCGYEPREFLEDSHFWLNHIHPDDIERVLSELSQLFELGHHAYKYRFLHKDGSYCWIYDALKLVRDEAGNPIECVGSWIDITQLKQVEQELQESQRWLQTITEANPNILYVYDLIERRNIYTNQQLWTILGYLPEELVQMGDTVLQHLMHPDDFAALPEHFKRFETAKDDEVFEFEYRMRDKNGEWHWLIGRDTVFTRTAEGKPKQILGAAADISDRKAIEIALQQSEARFQKLAANVPGMIYEFVMDPDGSFSFPYASSGGQEIFEIQPGQLMESSAVAFENIHPADRERFFESITRSAKTLEPWECEWRTFGRRSQKLKWLQGVSRPERLENGGILWHGLVIDISERVLVQESLRESEERFRTMADSTAVMLWVSDTYDLCTFVNRTWLEFTGRTLEEEIGLGWLDNLHPEDRQRCRDTSLKAFEVHESFEIEYRLRRFDGEYRWIVDLGKPRFTPNGSFAGYIGSCLDITERKQAEIEITTAKTALERQIQRVLLLERITQEIRSTLKSDQIFQTAATQIGQAFSANRCLIHTYIHHPTPRIPFVAEYKQPEIASVLDIEIPVIGNPHAQLMLTQDAAIASDNVYTDSLLEAAASPYHQLGLKSMLTVRTSYQGKPNGVIALHQYDRFRHWTGEEIELLESVAAQVGIAIAQANLLEQEKTRRRELAVQNHALEKAKLDAEAANRAKSQFLSKMSHELRTPLNAILGFTQVMARDHSLKIEQLEYLGIINRSGEHLLELINDILSMSKIEAGQVTLNESCFDLYQLLDSLEEMLRFKANSKGLELIFERHSELPQYIKTDEGKLRQVLINLLGNAIKFTQMGSVTLRVSVVGQWSGVSGTEQGTAENGRVSIEFEVEDTGPGIASEELGMLFQPFMQTQTGRQSQEGTGLGLPISQQFVRMMEGDITVSSIVGQGSIFTFDIQVSLASSADDKPTSSKRRIMGLEPNQPTYRILVVEDTAVNRKLLVKILEPLGFEVRTAANGQEGIAEWESWSPHLIFMDIFMPVMDGCEATQRIKQTTLGQNTVIIALTAGAFEEQRQAILKAGCDDFLPKPFRREILLEKMAYHLGVRYVYEEQQPSSSSQPAFLTKSLTREALVIMPTSWVAQLHQAALYADDELMSQLIEQIPLEHDSLRRTLREMLNNFRLEELINLTEPAES